MVVVEGLAEIRRIELYDLTGRVVFVTGELDSRQVTIQPREASTRYIYS